MKKTQPAITPGGSGQVVWSTKGRPPLASPKTPVSRDNAEKEA